MKCRFNDFLFFFKIVLCLRGKKGRRRRGEGKNLEEKQLILKIPKIPSIGVYF
jgi:hypothetical protein